MSKNKIRSFSLTCYGDTATQETGYSFWKEQLAILKAPTIRTKILETQNILFESLLIVLQKHDLKNF